MSGDLRTVAIVGAGLVGGSVAAAAREAGVPRVLLTDVDADVRTRAAALGLAHEVTDDLATAVRDADLVVAAVPAGVVADVLAAAAALAPATALLTDVASLKGRYTLDVESRLRSTGQDAGRFVGGHPMAGSERSGPEAADPALFQGATWVLTPTPGTADATLQTLSGFLRRLGARVVALPPEQHDELVAIVSHLPQVVASTLAAVAADAADQAGAAVLSIAGGGFRDTTRIAASDPDLWLGILDGNRRAVLEAVDAFVERLAAVRTALDTGDRAGLHGWLARASASRRSLVPKSAGAPGFRPVDLVIALDDRPGQLARATVALGGAGVNVEDLAMRHATDGRRGALLVRVAEGDVDQALGALTGAGLHVHADADTGTAARPDSGATALQVHADADTGTDARLDPGA